MYRDWSLSIWYDYERNNSSCWSNTPATQNTTDHTRFKVQQSHQRFFIHRAFQNRFSCLQIVEHRWTSRSYTSHSIGLKIRTLPELWPLHDIFFENREEPMAQSYTYTTSNIAKLAPKIWLVQNFELSKDLGSLNYQIHQTAVFMLHHPTKVTRTTSIMQASLTESINMLNCSRQTTRSWATASCIVSNRSIMARSSAIFWFWEIHKSCGIHQSTTIGGGYLNTKESFTGDKWTQLTILVNVMTHTAFTQSNLPASSAVLNHSFSSMRERWRIFRYMC